MKQLFLIGMMMSFIVGLSACSNKQIKSVLDDVSRDTYENNLRKYQNENIGEPLYEEPPSYDQYQEERKALSSDNF